VTVLAELTAKFHAVWPLLDERARRLMAMMSQELTSQLRTAAGGEGGVEGTAARMSKVFREWRTDECERWVRAIVDAAYHDELLAALVEGGYSAVRGLSAYTRPMRVRPGLLASSGASPKSSTSFTMRHPASIICRAEDVGLKQCGPSLLGIYPSGGGDVYDLDLKYFLGTCFRTTSSSMSICRRLAK